MKLRTYNETVSYSNGSVQTPNITAKKGYDVITFLRGSDTTFSFASVSIWPSSGTEPSQPSVSAPFVCDSDDPVYPFTGVFPDRIVVYDPNSGKHNVTFNYKICLSVGSENPCSDPEILNKKDD